MWNRWSDYLLDILLILKNILDFKSEEIEILFMIIYLAAGCVKKNYGGQLIIQTYNFYLFFYLFAMAKRFDNTENKTNRNKK